MEAIGNTPAELGYHAVAERIAKEGNAFYLDQYCSDRNQQAHYTDSGPELWTQLDGEIDIFLCGTEDLLPGGSKFFSGYIGVMR